MIGREKFHELSWQGPAKTRFGLMRLPMLGAEIDIEQVKTMTDKFLAAGFTYFDTRR
jgi:predicted aldo/keto reductase-like oxidoreductase